MTRALGTPQRGQTIPEVERLAIGFLLTIPFRRRTRMKDTRIVPLGLPELCISLSPAPFFAPFLAARGNRGC
jgi:hypothetical protein